MDFIGQKYAEATYFYLILLACVVGFVHGYLVDDFNVFFYYNAGGGAAAAVLVLPDWPMWNRNPTKWLEYDSDDHEGAVEEEDAQEVFIKDMKRIATQGSAAYVNLLMKMAGRGGAAEEKESMEAKKESKKESRKADKKRKSQKAS